MFAEIHGELKYFDQSISALITYLAKGQIKEIEMSIYEHWMSNGYGGLDYTVGEAYEDS